MLGRLIKEIVYWLGWEFADELVMELNCKSPYQRYYFIQEHSSVWEWGVQDVLNFTANDDKPFTKEEAIRFLNESDFRDSESMDGGYLSFLIQEWKTDGRYD